MSTVSFPTLDQLRARDTMKWTVYPDDVLPLWVAESDFDTCPPVNSAIKDAVERQYFGYEKRDGSVQHSVASFLARRYGWEVEESWIRLVPDVVKGVAVAIDELTPAGAPIVITRPSYYPFFDIPKATNRPATFVEMFQSSDGTWGFDFDALEQAFATAGSMILCSPYNPLGRAFTREELERLIELADSHNVRLISDEIHAPIVFGDATHIPAASISDTAARVVVTVTATSKGWNTAGLHCAQMIFTNPRDREIMAEVHALRTGSASTLGQVATMAAYDSGSEWLDAEVAYLKSNLDLLERRLPQVLPGVRFTRPEATFLLWVDTRNVPGLETEPARKILERARVAFNEGTTYGPSGAGHFRLNFATSQEILNEALDRLAMVV